MVFSIIVKRPSVLKRNRWYMLILIIKREDFRDVGKTTRRPWTWFFWEFLKGHCFRYRLLYLLTSLCFPSAVLSIEVGVAHSNAHSFGYSFIDSFWKSNLEKIFFYGNVFILVNTIMNTISERQKFRECLNNFSGNSVLIE